MDEPLRLGLGLRLLLLRRACRPPRLARAALPLAVAFLIALAVAPSAHTAAPLVRVVALPSWYRPVGIAVDPALGRAYVADDGGTVWMLDGADGRLLGRTALTIPAAGAVPTGAMAADPARHRVYVATTASGLAALDGRTGLPAVPWPLPATPALALDSATDRILLAQPDPPALLAVGADRRQVVAKVPLDQAATALALDERSRRVYVAERGIPNLAVFDADNFAPVGTVALGDVAAALAVDPTTHRLYAATALGGVLVADGVGAGVAALPVRGAAGPLALDPATGRLFVADADDGDVAVVDTRRDAVIALVPVGGRPIGAAVDERTGRVYIAIRADRAVAILQDRRGDLAFRPMPAAVPTAAPDAADAAG